METVSFGETRPEMLRHGDFPIRVFFVIHTVDTAQQCEVADGTSRKVISRDQFAVIGFYKYVLTRHL